jgi:hypothetical protein
MGNEVVSGEVLVQEVVVLEQWLARRKRDVSIVGIPGLIFIMAGAVLCKKNGRNLGASL